MPTMPLIVGHRGAADLAPENTLRAFRRGLAAGADMLECDVHLSADGKDVIIHDRTVDRTAQGDSPLRTVHRPAPSAPLGHLGRELTEQALAEAVEVRAATLAVRASHLREGDLERIRLAAHLQVPWLGADDPARTRRIVEDQLGL